MILDTSAILAVLFNEPEAEKLVEQIVASDVVSVGAPTLVEAGVVLGRRQGFDKKALLLRFLQAFQVNVIPFGEEHWEVACDAYEQFGKGRHKAALNFGDCLSYAMARVGGRDLLFVGSDFSRTDVAGDS